MNDHEKLDTAHKALEEIAKSRHAPSWDTYLECAQYWSSLALEYRRIARAALARQENPDAHPAGGEAEGDWDETQRLHPGLRGESS